MKNLTVTICLMIAVLLGSVGVSWGSVLLEGFSAYHDGDYSTALQKWKPLAEQGDAVAQYNLVRMYREGIGVQSSNLEANKWVERIGKQVKAGAHFYRMGNRFYKGSGVPKNNKQALKWFALAAQYGNLNAIKFLNRIKRCDPEIDLPYFLHGKRTFMNGRAVELPLQCSAFGHLTEDEMTVADKTFSAKLKHKRKRPVGLDTVEIRGQGGDLIYKRQFPGSSRYPLYVIYSGNKPFGWLVGWHSDAEARTTEYLTGEYSGEYKNAFDHLDFTVARLIVPFVTNEGKQKVFTDYFHGLYLSKFANEDRENQFTFPVLDYQLPIGCGSNICTWWYMRPRIYEIKRDKAVRLIEKKYEDYAKKFRTDQRYLYGEAGLNDPVLRYVFNVLDQNISGMKRSFTEGKIAQRFESALGCWDRYLPDHPHPNSRATGGRGLGGVSEIILDGMANCLNQARQSSFLTMGIHLGFRDAKTLKSLWSKGKFNLLSENLRD